MKKWYLSGRTKNGTTIAGWWFNTEKEAKAFYRKKLVEEPYLRYRLEYKEQ